MDNKPEDKKPNAPAPDRSVTFKSDYIGQWAAKQDDPFAEQNRKAAEKKAAQEAARKKAMPYVKIGSITAACVAVIIIAVVIIVNITKPKPLPEVTTEESAAMTEEAQKIFDKHTQNINLDDTENLTEKEKEDIQKAVEEVGKYYEQQAERAQDNTVIAQVIMEEMSFYLWNNQPEAALNASEKFQTEGLDSTQLSNFYGMMQELYLVLGDEEQAERYLQLMIDVIGEEYYVAG